MMYFEQVMPVAIENIIVSYNPNKSFVIGERTIVPTRRVQPDGSHYYYTFRQEGEEGLVYEFTHHTQESIRSQELPPSVKVHVPSMPYTHRETGFRFIHVPHEPIVEPVEEIGS